MAESLARPRRTHVVPTHVRVPETLLTLAGIDLSVRQFLLALCGMALSYRLFLGLAFLVPVPGGTFLRFGLAVLPLAASLALAFVQVGGRRLDTWCLVWARYLLRPKRLVWRSIRFQEPVSGAPFRDKEDDADALPA